VRGVLRLGPFRRLLAAYTLNELAWSFGALALALLVYRRTGSALGSTAFFLCTQFLPALISPISVARLDQLHPRVVLSLLYALEAGLYVALGFTASHVSVAIVLVIATADGVIALTARSLARAATVAVTSEAGLLREGNALANSLFSICFMAGPAIGGVVVVAGGTKAALLVNGAVFVVITATLATARGLPEPVRAPGPRRGRIRAALAHARERPLIRLLLILQTTLMLFFTMSIPVEVVYAQHSLHTGAAGYGVLLSAWGAGAVAGSTIYAKWRRLPVRELIALGSAFLGVGFVVMAVAPSIAIAVVGSVIAGVGNGIEAVAARTALQEQVEAQWMALMMSFNESLTQAVPGAGILLGGAIATLASPRAALALGGIGGLVVTSAVWVLLRPSRAGPPAPPSSGPTPGRREPRTTPHRGSPAPVYHELGNRHASPYPSDIRDQ
jgi:predicted MFS family arabinose efflux permease